MQENLDTWKEAEAGDFWKPENKGEELEGEYIEQLEGTYGSTFKIKKADGTVVSTPSYKVLISRMANVPRNSLVKIIYDGEEPPKQRGWKPTKLFRVMYKEAN